MENLGYWIAVVALLVATLIAVVVLVAFRSARPILRSQSPTAIGDPANRRSPAIRNLPGKLEARVELLKTADSCIASITGIGIPEALRSGRRRRVLGQISHVSM